MGLGQNGGDDTLMGLDGGGGDLVSLEEVEGGGGVLAVVGGVHLSGPLLDPEVLIFQGGENVVAGLGLLEILLAILGGSLELGKFPLQLVQLLVDDGGLRGVLLGQGSTGLFQPGDLVLQSGNLSLDISMLNK